MTLSELQAQADAWIKTYGVRYFSEQTNMILLTEEVGELARLVGRAYGEQSFKEPLEGPALKAALADEMADIIFVLTCLANQMGLDLTEAVHKNFEKKTQRDKNRHKNNHKLT